MPIKTPHMEVVVFQNRNRVKTMSIYGALDRIVQVTSHSSLGTTGTHKFL